MSDAGQFSSGASLPFEALSAMSGFRSDARFTSLGEAPYRRAGPQPAPPAEPQAEPHDPLAAAFAEGYAAGAAAAEALAAERETANLAASEGLTLAFAKLDADLEQELRQRLRDTVAALCEAAIAPLALDEAMLMRRIERAVSMLARADDERLIRLHPDDIALVGPRLAADWQIQPDPTLERGGLRVETTSGGVEDGPDLWRRAIAEALRQC